MNRLAIEVLAISKANLFIIIKTRQISIDRVTTADTGISVITPQILYLIF